MALTDEQREHFRQTLHALRRRMIGSVDYVVEALNDEANTLSNLSSVPVHLVDTAQTGSASDVELLDNENNLLHNIEAAISRLNEGMYGTCERCGKDIVLERLKALPFATKCTACAAAEEAPRSSSGRDSR